MILVYKLSLVSCTWGDLVLADLIDMLSINHILDMVVALLSSALMHFCTPPTQTNIKHPKIKNKKYLR